MTERRLTPSERQIWQRVARTVAPRQPGRAKPRHAPEDFANMIRLPPPETRRHAPPETELALNHDKKTRRGRIHIDAQIDLHDKTREQAYPLLAATLKRAHSRKLKCVLVITGKGARLDGVLRGAFSGWINSPDIRPFIATYAQAHIKHGGSGAWYVFLKKSPAP